MKVSLNWLKRYVPLEGRSADEICHAFTLVGFEVDAVTRTGLPPHEHVVVGEVLTRERHPQADKLSVCSVRIAPDAPGVPIVCGAQNYSVGDHVPVALPGAVLAGGFRIGVSRIRGVESHGMMCSARELGAGEDEGGLLILAHRPAVGLPINAALPGGDVIFTLEVTPNRPDALCHLGLARELAAWFRLPLTYPEIEFIGPADATGGRRLLAGVEVLAPEACPLYTAHVIAGVRLGPSPGWLQEALTNAGLRPVNNVVDATNFVLLETGQPLHAFDAARIRGPRLVIRPAAAGERITTLDGRERTLATRHLVIADAGRALVIAGVMGGADAEVDERTTDIVLEAAYFAPAGIRRASKDLGLSTDSSYRFERGLDPAGVLGAARRCLDLILATAGGEVLGPVIVAGSEPVWTRELTLSPAWVRERLGFEIGDERQREILESLEMEVAHEEETVGGRKTWTVTIPSWRGDLERPIDLVEEILRFYGTDRIPAARFGVPSVVGHDDAVTEFVRRASTLFTAHGFYEATNGTLRAAREVAAFAPLGGGAERRLQNPLAEDQSDLRHSLLPGLLETLRRDQDHGNDACRFFEAGRCFREAGGQLYEVVALAFAVRLPSSPGTWLRRGPFDYFAAKRLAQETGARAGLDLGAMDYRRLENSLGGWQAGHSAEAGGLDAGCEVRLGLVNLEVTRALGLEGSVVAGEIHALPDRLHRVPARPRYAAFSLQPAASRDLAIVAEEATPAAEVEAALVRAAHAAAAGRFAVEQVRVFDVYQGAGLPPGRRSLAFSLRFRAADRTLTDEEVNQVLADIQSGVEGGGRFQIRK